ncbi:MAG: hypothetical protein C0467_29200 [Planctomycetaceae bacterium]|nr:hypothetical protein [Planctomycetaceae bacterium]
MSPDPLGLGPLPQSDSNDELQQRSLVAFRVAVPTNLFLVRDERVDDKGVDLALEVKAGDRFTNIRAQVQLKATRETGLNTDGSFSFSVATSNLNYLLNGQCPMYGVWIAPRNELRLVWARDEARRLHAVNPNWQEQDTVTLRFPRPTRPDEWGESHARVLREGRLHRQSHDALTRAATAAPITLGVNPTTLAVTAPDQASEILTEHGLAMISGGNAPLVLDLVRLLQNEVRALPHTRFIVGYAHYAQGDYFTARSELGRATSGRDQFDPVDRYVLDALLSGCDYRLGRIDEIEFRDAQRRQEGAAPPSVAAQLRLDRLRTEHLRAHDDVRRIELLTELRRTTDAIQAMSVGGTLKLEARVVRLYAEGAENNFAFLNGICRMQMRLGMGRTPLTPAVLSELAAVQGEAARLDAEAFRLIGEAQTLGHPLLIADALCTHAVILLGRIVDSRTQATLFGRTPPPFPAGFLDEMDRRLEHAARCFERAGNTEGVVRAAILLADWMEVTGREMLANQHLERVLGLARGMGYDHYVEQIEAALAGDSDYRRYTNRVMNPPDLDAEMAAMSDEDVRRYALDCLTSAELPAERLPVVERECFSARAICQEKMNWCRHLELFQDRRHQLSPATHYRTDPPRVGHCTLHRHQSGIEYPDWVTVITAFKSCYCVGCADRSPKPARTAGQ